jgi:hypothetical protein
VVPPESSEPATQAADSHLATEAGSAISAIISKVLADPTRMDAAAAELAVAVNRPEPASASAPAEMFIAAQSTDIPSEVAEGATLGYTSLHGSAARPYNAKAGD